MPLKVRWPAGLGRGTVDAVPAIAMDLSATILALTAVGSAAAAGRGLTGLDGVSLLPWADQADRAG